MSELNINVDSKFLTRLIDVIASGVGAVSKSWLMRRDARALADVQLIEAQTGQEIKKITEGAAHASDSGESREVSLVPQQLIESLPDNGAIAERVQARLDYQEEKRQKNLEDIAQIAAAEKPQQVADGEVDPDWIAKFFSNAQDVSNANMKAVWGKILAGEISQPGQFSMRTLDALKNLSYLEAQTVNRILTYAIGDFILSDDKFFEDNGIKYSDFLFLEEIGVLTIQPTLQKIFGSADKDKFVGYLQDRKTILLLAGDDPAKLPGVNAHILTSVGKNLASLIEDEPPQIYLKQIAKAFQRKKITVSRVKKVLVKTASGEEIRYIPENIDAT